MKRSSYLVWFRRLVVLGAVVAGVTASAAGAVPMLDPQDTPADPVVSHTTPLGVRADGLRLQAIAKAYQQNGKTDVSHSTALGVRADGLRFQAIAKAYQQSRQAPVPDVFERYAATHPNGHAIVSPTLGTERVVDDSFRDPTPIATQAGDRIVDDSFRDAAPTVPTSTASSDTLDWGAFGIGAGAMLGLALLTGLGLGSIAMRHRAGKLEVS